MCRRARDIGCGLYLRLARSHLLFTLHRINGNQSLITLEHFFSQGELFRFPLNDLFSTHHSRTLLHLKMEREERLVTESYLEAALEKRDDGIRKEFKNVYTRMEENQEDIRFEIKMAMDRTNLRFDRVDQRLYQMEERLTLTAAIESNSRAELWNDPIAAVGVFKRDAYIMPDRLPNRVMGF